MLPVPTRVTFAEVMVCFPKLVTVKAPVLVLAVLIRTAHQGFRPKKPPADRSPLMTVFPVAVSSRAGVGVTNLFTAKRMG